MFVCPKIDSAQSTFLMMRMMSCVHITMKGESSAVPLPEDSMIVEIKLNLLGAFFQVLQMFYQGK